MKIVADENIPFLKGVLEKWAEVTYMPGNKITRRVLADTDALLTRTRTKCTKELLEGTAVRFIGTATIGFDHIDTQYCEKQGITWTNAPGCNSSSVQQYIAAALLKMSAEFRQPLRGKVLGIIGVGNVGSKVQKLASLLDMEILLNDPPRERREGSRNFVSLLEVLERSDILTLHVPLNIVGEDSTWHLINEKTLKKVKKGSWLVNSSRGEVADTTAIKKALSSGRLGGAILDVWEHEPDIDLDLMSRTFLATPHIAGYSTDGKANGTSMVVNALCRHFNLPAKDWYPDDIPAPEHPLIPLDGVGKTEEAILREAVSHTYNIDEDDMSLRFSPSDFEKLRGGYRLRREFPAYSVALNGGTKRVRKMLEGLGFRVV